MRDLHTIPSTYYIVRGDPTHDQTWALHTTMEVSTPQSKASRDECRNGLRYNHQNAMAEGMYGWFGFESIKAKVQGLGHQLVTSIPRGSVYFPEFIMLF